ncbi:MAG: CinA family protein, partial [Gammaproteobacteria bacterium]
MQDIHHLSPDADDAALAALAEQLARRLLERGLKLACAESCTGGWIAKCLTDIAGSSDWFERGFVTYSNSAKQDALGVSAETLSMHGAVSEQSVREMAVGVLRHSQAQVAVAVSGIAGPTGGSADKPVGTVWIGWAWPDRSVSVKHCHFDG